MAKLALRNGRIIGDYEKPYIIAEVNSSHMGDVDTAKQMIDKAKSIGCDCVKFQSWSADTLYSQGYYVKNPIAKRIVNKFALSEQQLLELANYCIEVDISFASTPYSEEEVIFLLNECNAPFIKIASMEINNVQFLEFIAKTQAPIVLSTGMADMEEIKVAVSVIENAGNSKIAILHCVSIYPAQPSIIHLNNILGLRDVFSMYPVGYSDHSLGVEIASAATALGAAIIEKHFTLDSSVIGLDNNMATEPEEFAQMVTSCHNVSAALGSRERIVTVAEREQRKKMRRSIVAAKDLDNGTVLTENNFEFKRPGEGLPPDKADQLIGKKINRDIQIGDFILSEDLVE